MCGIAGIWRRDGAPIDLPALERMTAALARRGPDDSRVWAAGRIGFGHRRLSIRDLSDAGSQPMSDAGGRVWVTFNGELYNDADLARELERDHGLVRRSRCDTEIIPLGYLAWGEAIFERMEGMFAVALWDVERRRLLLARDGVGIKPLYVADSGTAVHFASEIKALLTVPEIGFALQPGRLLEYLAQGYTTPGTTLLAGVDEVPPGTVRRYDEGGVRERRFWQPVRRPDIRRLEDATDALAATLPAVVDSMLVSDVPLGVLQSGGIDSTLISLSISGDRTVPLFTAVFSESSHDETAVASAVAIGRNRPHHLVPIDTVEDPAAVFVETALAADGHLADSSSFAFLLLSKAVRRHVTVALSGDGADEFFGGYPTYRATRLASRLAALVPEGVARRCGEALHGLGGADERRQPAAEVAARFLTGLAAGFPGCHAEWRRLMTPADIAHVAGPALSAAGGDPLSGYKAAIEAGDEAVDRVLLADQRFYLPGDMLQKVDRMSMAASLEIRVPFLDRRIMDLAGRLDARLLSPLRPPDKRVLRSLAGRWSAPASVVSGPKRGFNIPIARLLRGPLAALGRRLLVQEGEALLPWLDPAGVARMWTEHAERRRNHGFGLWAILVFAVWLRDASNRRGAIV